ncbi:MAG: DUF58 domain-containing protein [Lachnospiraceae bacterium]
MKKIVCIVGWCLLFYAAGAFQQEAVLAAVLAVGILGILLFLLSRYQAASIRANIVMERTSGRKGELFNGKVCLENGSVMPVSHCLIRLEYGHEQYGKKEIRNMEGMLKGKGKAEVSFSIQPMYAGTALVRISSIKAWDLLGLFCGKKRIQTQEQIVVFPNDSCMKIKEEKMLTGQGREIDKAGNIPPDVFQIHPYQPGEPLRAVHWKLTARLDDMMSRQYSDEVQSLPILYFQRGKIEGMNLERMDAYWEVAAALSKGLLYAGIPHAVVWNEREELFHRMEVHTDKDFVLTLKEAMQYSRETEADRQSWLYERLRKENGETVPLVIIDQMLRVYKDGELIVQFSWERYRQEIEKRWVSV